MIELNEEKVKAFTYAVKNNYWYQMYIDDLPIWGRVGERGERGDDKHFYIFTHKKFEIGYNGNRIVDVKLTTENRQALEPGAKLKFTYEVTFYSSNVDFKDRFNKYLDPTFFQHRVNIQIDVNFLCLHFILTTNSNFECDLIFQIHWFSIFNSFMMVIFLVGLVSMILMRTLRKDYQRYSKDEEMDDMERDLGDEYGWKQVHGDVFRSPTHNMLFSSLIGTGYQLTTVVFSVIIFAIIGELYTEYV